MSSAPRIPDQGGVRVAAGAAPRPLLATSALVALEGVAVFGLGALQLVRGFGGDIDDPVRAEIGAVIALLGGVGLVLVARALLLGRRWARSPVLVTQLLSFPVAWSLVQNDLPAYGVPLALVAGTVVVLLLAAGGYRPDDEHGFT